jgi:hypothetical protein
MRAKKDRRTPAPEELPRIFDDSFIQKLALQAKLPQEANIQHFAAAIRDAAERYVADRAIPSDTVIRDEIKALYSAANRHRYKETATRINVLSTQARAFLERGDSRGVGLAILQPEPLADHRRRDDACEAIAAFLRVGMKGGKPLLIAPQPRQRPPRREAELTFVMWLGVAYFDATRRTPPPHTANPDRPGPFARMVQTCLDEVAPGADAVGLINEMHRRRNLKPWQSGTAPKA